MIAYLAAFFAIYVLWGFTFFAIRVAVGVVPPFYVAGVRFTLAGATLYLWSCLRRLPGPTRQQWKNLIVLGVLMFLLPYAGLFWAEQKLPSGIASVLVATIPISTTLLEAAAFRRNTRLLPLLAATAAGLVGVAVLVMDTTAGKADPFSCVVIIASSCSWAAGSVLAKKMALPESKVTMAGIQMMSGGVLLLLLAGVSGEVPPWPHFTTPAVLALSYLTVAGSIIAFTAYVWLLHRMPASKVASYAYVNPLVALAVGHWLGKESFGANTFIGAALILTSVYLILKIKPARS